METGRRARELEWFWKMETIKVVLKNAVALSISAVGTRVLAGIRAILLIRYLGKNLYGEYSTAVAFTGLFAVLLDAGLSPGLVRAGSQSRDNLSWFYGNVTFIKLFLSFTVYFLIIFIQNFK